MTSLHRDALKLKVLVIQIEKMSNKKKIHRFSQYSMYGMCRPFLEYNHVLLKIVSIGMVHIYKNCTAEDYSG